MKRHKGTKAQRHKGTKAQRHKVSGVKAYRDSIVWQKGIDLVTIIYELSEDRLQAKRQVP